MRHPYAHKATPSSSRPPASSRASLFAGHGDKGQSTAIVDQREQGKLSNVKGVGEGVLEYRLDLGPGYRGYFGRDGDVLVILLAGGTKQRQQCDIRAAQARWAAYKRRKRLAR